MGDNLLLGQLNQGKTFREAPYPIEMSGYFTCTLLAMSPDGQFLPNVFFKSSVLLMSQFHIWCKSWINTDTACNDESTLPLLRYDSRQTLPELYPFMICVGGRGMMGGVMGSVMGSVMWVCVMGGDKKHETKNLVYM